MTADVAVSDLTNAHARLEAIVRRGLAAAAADGHATDVTGEAARHATRGADDLPALALEGTALGTLARAYSLAPFDLDVLLLALGPEIDLRYERVYAYLQDDATRKRPTVNLALELLCGGVDVLAARTRFAPSAPLLQHRVIEWVDGPDGVQPLLASSFRPDDQIVRFLTGGSGLDSRLARIARVIAPAVSFETCGLGESAVALERVVDAALATEEPITVAMHGPDEHQRTAAAHAVAERAGRPLLLVDLSTDADLETLLPIIVREAELQGAVLMFEHWAQLRSVGGASLCRRLAAALTAHAGITILSDFAAWEPISGGPAGVVSFQCAQPPFDVSRACWSEAVAMATGTVDADLAQTMASRFRLTVDQIWNAAVAARRLAAARAADGEVAIPKQADFLTAARRQSTSDFAGLATRVRPAASWGQLVLPEDALAQLHELAERIEFGHTVLGSWGFDRGLSYGKGAIALFSGPPGPGKTMAAEVIAGELGLDLYRVEIPAIVSKWVGETEKNLDRLFSGAENAILLFDEADALFGRRSEVHDAHDRYANIEVSFLLQRLEAFDGLAILSTNMRHNVDEAFLRRLSFLVQFPFPDDLQRERIWARVWPAETPRSADLDFAWLARQFRVSGGHIKNIALAAAYRAASRGASVAMADVLHAVRREYQKLGKQLDPVDLAAPTAVESLA
jgi:hypothetical protein